MSIDARITAPVDGAKKIRGVTHAMTIQQQAQGTIGAGFATLQFSNDPSGPWTTARTIGSKGAITANPVEWNESDTTIQIQYRIEQSCEVRFGVWPDQNFNGAPQLDPSTPISLTALTVTSEPEP